MLLGERGSRWRCLVVGASATSALGAVALVALPRTAGLWTTRSSLDTLPLDLALVDASAGVMMACAAWAWLAVIVTVAEAWRGAGHAPGRLWRPPLGVRRVVLAACGVVVASAVTVPAHSDDRPDHEQARGVRLLSGLPLPDRADAPHGPTHPNRVLPDRTVTVRPGDTLWSIAARDLPADASAHAIASRWHTIYRTNHRLIGSDPGLIKPGQHLLLSRKDRP